MKHRIGAALFAASAAFALSGCVTDDYGYGSVGVGYGSGYYAGDPYWGWYDNYYYPGTGYYIYDRGGKRHRWSDNHRRYWEGRRGGRSARENWDGYRRDNNPSWRGQRQRAIRQGETAESREARREAWRAQRQQQGASEDGRGRGRWGADRQRSGQEARGRGGGGGREGRRNRGD